MTDIEIIDRVLRHADFDHSVSLSEAEMVVKITSISLDPETIELIKSFGRVFYVMPDFMLCISRTKYSNAT